MFMCSNKNCPWPFDSVYKAAEISGKSDINKLVKAMKLGGETDSNRDGLKEAYFHKKGEESASNSSSSNSGKFSKKLWDGSGARSSECWFSQIQNRSQDLKDDEIVKNKHFGEFGRVLKKKSE